METQATPKPRETKAFEPPDIREKGGLVDGVPQVSTKRLYFQFHAFGNCSDVTKLTKAFEDSGLEGVVYLDANDPKGVGILHMSESPLAFVDQFRSLLLSPAFSGLQHKADMTMIGRTYSTGHEPDLEDWLLKKPRRNALSSRNSWAVWYPLKRKSEFYLLSREEQGKILMEHAVIGRAYGQAGYAQDIRLSCYGLDKNDNEFVIGLVGEDLFPLSRLVQEMRKTQQTARYMERMGPFFIGRVAWQSPLSQ